MKNLEEVRKLVIKSLTSEGFDVNIYTMFGWKLEASRIVTDDNGDLKKEFFEIRS